MSLKFGFEREYFIVDAAGEISIAKNRNVDHDGCGYLAEARGTPMSCPIEAAYSLLASENKLETKVNEAKHVLCKTADNFRLSTSFKQNCIRLFGKTAQSDCSLYGKWNAQSVSHAGLHVHFSDSYEIIDKNDRIIHVYKPMNIPKIIVEMDREFGPIIKDSKRAKGLYKMKPYGFEYRSLPTSINIITVANFLVKLSKTL